MTEVLKETQLAFPEENVDQNHPLALIEHMVWGGLNVEQRL